MYDCKKHGYYGFEPCELCLRDLDMKKSEAMSMVPKTIVKHVHAPGPCPECARRRDRDATQRWTLLLALFLAILGWILASAAPGLIQGPWKAISFIPAAIVALIGVFLGIPKTHTERAEGGLE